MYFGNQSFLNYLRFIGYANNQSNISKTISIDKTFAEINNIKNNEIYEVSVENSHNNVNEIDVFC